MKIHVLKLHEKYYFDSLTNCKTFEIRKNDRDFKVGDILKLVRVINSGGDGRLYVTSQAHYKQITYILDNPEYLQDGYVCLGLQPIPEPEQAKVMYE